jgi:hypothetical protein
MPVAAVRPQHACRETGAFLTGGRTLAVILGWFSATLKTGMAIYQFSR